MGEDNTCFIIFHPYAGNKAAARKSAAGGSKLLLIQVNGRLFFVNKNMLFKPSFEEKMSAGVTVVLAVIA